MEAKNSNATIPGEIKNVNGTVPLGGKGNSTKVETVKSDVSSEESSSEETLEKAAKSLSNVLNDKEKAEFNQILIEFNSAKTLNETVDGFVRNILSINIFFLVSFPNDHFIPHLFSINKHIQQLKLFEFAVNTTKIHGEANKPKPADAIPVINNTI